MKPLIEFNNVSKKYRIGLGSMSLRSAMSAIPKLFLKNRPNDNQDLWAIKDISFDISAGESIGILGHNGAGKTTILKLISEITYPSKGNIIVRGKLGSLIELGAGFHPEMTGRENVYLNGSILGLSQNEIKSKFDNIVDFAGVEKFIDTPVKRYSSGMYVRLAFAVAANINPDILLVDEVLAVGDIAFRAKCYRRMAELRKSGTTIILVSHDVYAIRDTCDKALLLWEGKLAREDDTENVITEYLSRMEHYQKKPAGEFTNKSNDDENTRQHHVSQAKVSIEKFEILNPENVVIREVKCGDSLRLVVHYKAFERLEKLILRIDFYRDKRIYSGFSTAYDSIEIPSLIGKGICELCVQNIYLPPGVYSISIVISDEFEYNLMDVHHQTYPVEVLRSENSRGEVNLPHTWKFQKMD